MALAILTTLYVGIALLVIAMRVHDVRADPSDMPGGGIPAIVATGLFWPVLLAIAIPVLVFGLLLGHLFDRLGL